MQSNDDPFATPAEVSAVDMAFGGDIQTLLPAWESIPEDFKRGRTKWNKVVTTWFFDGLPKGTRCVPKRGINESAAKAHLRAVLCSVRPKHEHKEAGCAYLLSKWFDDVLIPRPQ